MRLWVCVAARFQIVVSELKHYFVSQAVTKLLDEPVVFKHVVYKITIILYS
jgi:hypothetical protein